MKEEENIISRSEEADRRIEFHKSPLSINYWEGYADALAWVLKENEE